MLAIYFLNITLFMGESYTGPKKIRYNPDDLVGFI